MTKFFGDVHYWFNESNGSEAAVVTGMDRDVSAEDFTTDDELLQAA